jgi:hypothetical protein
VRILHAPQQRIEGMNADISVLNREKWGEARFALTKNQQRRKTQIGAHENKSASLWVYYQDKSDKNADGAPEQPDDFYVQLESL